MAVQLHTSNANMESQEYLVSMWVFLAHHTYFYGSEDWYNLEPQLEVHFFERECSTSDAGVQAWEAGGVPADTHGWTPTTAALHIGHSWLRSFAAKLPQARCKTWFKKRKYFQHLVGSLLV